MTGDQPKPTVVRLSDVVARRPPWPHWPHCPACHARVVSYDPASTYRWSGRTVHDATTFTGTACPACGADLGRRDTSRD